jgi:hypothetical protein
LRVPIAMRAFYTHLLFIHPPKAEKLFSPESVFTTGC